jgi:carbon-monoxide dehydrogenase large subunit
MGEGGAVNAPAAVVAAVNDALAPFGVVANHTPLTPEWVLGALHAAREGVAARAPVSCNLNY